ncbi:attacin-like [Battus philenor]|uniref:attacin-like n=1 Tax=Battus philenor TaxID=42288 RepID=UPI0035CF0C59
MFRSMSVLIAVLLACVNSRHLPDDFRSPILLVKEGQNIIIYDLEDVSSEEPIQELHEQNLPRVRRQAQGSLSTNPDGSSNFAAKFPLAGDDKNRLSAIGTIAGASGDGGFKAGGGGLAWDNVNGHGATLTGQHIPGFGDQLTAAGKANFHNDKHDVTASAFATRTFPSNPNIPNFDTYGGKVGYTYDNKMGASLGMAQTDLFKKTDYSAMGNLNLFKDRTSSLDLSAGMSKSVSPYMPSRGWEPSAGLSFTKWF